MKDYHFEGQVRRTDLRFRSAYPYIPTRIYQLSEQSFAIAIIGDWSDFDKLKKEFDHKISPAGTPVTLLCAEPKHYERELDAIPDSDIVCDFSGFSLNLSQLDALIPSLLPQFDYLGAAADHSNQTIKYYFKTPIEEEGIEYINDKLVNLELPYNPKICIKNSECPSVQRSSEATVSNHKRSYDVMSMGHYTKYDSLKLPYLKRDDEYWFDNVEPIYRREFRKENLFFWDKDRTSCYLDLSVFENINIRNHILLYDRIYMTLPLGSVNSLLQKHNISRNELLWLIENKRLVILNVQPDSRLDTNFLQEAYERRSEAVVSRRAVAALCAMDLIELNVNFIFNGIFETTKLENEIKKILSAENGNRLLNFLFWPKSALRKSFESLLLGGPMSIPTYGVNRILEATCQNDKKLQFEYSVASMNAHIAHALGATYFPFVTDKGYTDAPFSAKIGNTLNVYKSCSFESFEPYSRLIKNTLNNNISNSVYEALNINEFVGIEEFTSCSDMIKDKSIGMSLIGRLAELPPCERENEIIKYNNAVLEFSNRKKNLSSTINTTLDIASVYPPLAIIIKALSFFKKINPKIEQIFSNIIDDAVATNELAVDSTKIKYLHQINSIAKLKKNISRN